MYLVIAIWRLSANLVARRAVAAVLTVFVGVIDLFGLHPNLRRKGALGVIFYHLAPFKR